MQTECTLKENKRKNTKKAKDCSVSIYLGDEFIIYHYAHFLCIGYLYWNFCTSFTDLLQTCNEGGSQKLILIALCTTELIYAIADITYFSLVLSRVPDIGSVAVLLFSITTLTFFYIFVMTLMVIDRFLEVYLNIKYDIPLI